MAQSFPDIEIYIKHVDANAVLTWLNTVFELVDTSTKGKRTLFEFNSPLGILNCVLFPNAVKGNFASLWFKSGNTPWDSDRECALEAFSHLNQEIRCSTGSWQTTDAENDETWLCINTHGETLIHWQT